MSDKVKKYARGAREFLGPQYDSDEDLDEATKKKIENARDSESEKLRETSWEKADLYPKLKRTLKSAWYGDKRKKQE